MNKNTIFYIIALVMLSLGMLIFVIGSSAKAGGPWSNQYCDVEVTQIRVVDQQGNVVKNLTEEKVVCNDGASDFLFDMGIAENCEMYTWDMPVGEVVITQRQIACKKMDGTGYEIVQGYHSID
tara:strand:- start:393 stop:761 length:369 start_codon:yes stop_codon:yes gene_type:complete